MTRTVGHAAAKRSITHRVTSAVMSLVVLVLAVGFVIAAVAVRVLPLGGKPGAERKHEPTIPTGGVVLTERVPVDDLAVGDIVMFERPTSRMSRWCIGSSKVEPSAHGRSAHAGRRERDRRPVAGAAGRRHRHGRARIHPLRRDDGARHPVSRRPHALLAAAGLLIVGRARPARWRSKRRPGNGLV